MSKMLRGAVPKNEVPIISYHSFMNWKWWTGSERTGCGGKVNSYQLLFPSVQAVVGLVTFRNVAGIYRGNCE